MFRERKVAQMAAFLLAKAGGKLNILKLMKLLYLADREAMGRYGEPISFDFIAAMPHGPVLSLTYDLANGSTQSQPDGWDAFVTDRAEHEVSIREGMSGSREQLRELSDADVEVLEAVWATFGKMGKWEIRDYTHSKCGEWTDPEGSSKPISYRDVFLALGKPPEIADELAEQIASHRKADRVIAQL